MPGRAVCTMMRAVCARRSITTRLTDAFFRRDSMYARAFRSVIKFFA